MRRAYQRESYVILGGLLITFAATLLVYRRITRPIRRLSVENPLFTDDPIAGAPILNALLVAYALPALLAAILARRTRRPRDAGALATLA